MKIKLLAITLIALCSNCTYEKDDLSDAYDLLYVKKDNSSMPVHIHGNIASNVFLLVLHGGPGGNGLEYRPGVFSEELEKDYAVAYYDQRGQGMSQGHLSAEENTLETMVEDVFAVLQVLKHKYGSENSYFLLGHSWGGTLGTAFMTTKDYQGEVKGWIEVDGAHDSDLLLRSQVRMINSIGGSEIQKERDIEFWQEFIAEAATVDTNNYSLDNLIKLNSKSFEAEGRLQDAELIRDGTEDYLDASIVLKSAFFSINPITNFFSGNFTNGVLIEQNGAFDTDISDDLAKITTPTLLLWGAYDFVVPPALGHQAFQNISTEDKKLVIFEESGHSPMSNEGDLFRSEVVDFIEKYK